MRNKILVSLLLIIPYFAINMNAKSLYVGQSTILSAPNPPSGAALSQVAWGCSNANVSVEKYMNYGAKVTVNSYFTGSAEIRCDYYWYWYDNNGFMHTNHASTYFYVTCNPVTLTIEPTSMQLAPGEGQYINYSYSPSNVSPKPTIRFFSSDTNVATVNDNGYVRAVSTGTAIITVKNSAGPDATCYVNVKQTSPTGVSLPNSLSLTVSETKTLTPTVTPLGASTSFMWSSDDNSIATVNAYGNVTGVKAGTTKVRVKTTVGGYSDWCSVTVKNLPVDPTEVTMKNSLKLYAGFAYTLVPVLKPDDAETTYTWKSDNASVAVVSIKGKVIAREEGTATITVTTKNGLTATCDVIVTKLPANMTVNKVNDKIKTIENLINKTFNNAY